MICRCAHTQTNTRVLAGMCTLCVHNISLLCLSICQRASCQMLSHNALPCSHVCDRLKAMHAGCIGGSGGKVWHDALRGGYGISNGRDEVSVPGTSLHSSFIGAVLYFWLAVSTDTLTFRQGHALLTVLLVRFAVGLRQHHAMDRKACAFYKELIAAPCATCGSWQISGLHLLLL